MVHLYFNITDEIGENSKVIKVANFPITASFCYRDLHNLIDMEIMLRRLPVRDWIIHEEVGDFTTNVVVVF